MQKLIIITLISMSSILNKLAESDASIKRMQQTALSSEPVESVDWGRVQAEGDQELADAEYKATNPEDSFSAPIDAHKTFWGQMRVTRAKIAAMYIEWDTTNKGAWKKLKSLYKMYDKATSVKSSDPFLLKIVKYLYAIPIVGTEILMFGAEKLWDMAKTGVSEGFGLLKGAYEELSGFLTTAKTVHEVREKKALVGEAMSDLDKLKVPQVPDPIVPGELGLVKQVKPEKQIDPEAEALDKRFKELEREKGLNDKSKKQYRTVQEQKLAEETDENYETIYRNLMKVRNADWKKSISSIGADEARYSDVETLKNLPGVVQDLPKEDAMKILKKYPSMFYSTFNTNYNLMDKNMKVTVKKLDEWKERDLKDPILRAAMRQASRHEILSKMDFGVQPTLNPMQAQMGIDNVQFSQGAAVDTNSPQFKGSIIGGARIDGLKPDLLNFHQELLSYVPEAKITSAYRPGSITKGGKLSRHGSGEAIDYGVNSNSTSGVKEFLYSSQGQSLLRKYGLNFIDETIPAVNAATVKSASGAYHVGKDSSAANNRLNYINLDPRFGAKKPVSISRSYAPQSYNPLPPMPNQYIPINTVTQTNSFKTQTSYR